MNHLYVCKFGGTSLATPERVEQVRRILENTEDGASRRYVVVSAPGARQDGDPKVTKLLKDLAADCFRERDDRTNIPLVADRYEQIFPGSGDMVFEDIERRCDAQLEPDAFYAHLLSAGEYWMARLFAEKIGGTFVDAAKVIRVEGSLRDARVLPETYEHLAAIQEEPRVVIPGFYGATQDNFLGLLNDGGSDRTGSIVALGVGAEVYENFSDSAVRAASPKLVPDARTIREMTYKELRDLSYSGFEIFQQQAVSPLDGSSVTLHIRSTADFPQPGTVVTSERVSDNPVVGIAYKPGFCAFSVEAPGVNEDVGVLHSLLGVFQRRRISVEFPASGIDDISAILAQDQVRGRVSQLTRELADVVDAHRTNGSAYDRNGRPIRPAETHFQDNLGCLVVAGKGLRHAQEIQGRIVHLLEGHGVEIVASSKGHTRRCLLYAIPQHQGKKAVNALYNEFIGS